METKDSRLRIGFAGSLACYWPGSQQASPFQGLKDWLWTYQIKDIDHHTRSAYYLFKGIERCCAKYPAEAGMLEVALWGLIDPGNVRQAQQMGIDKIVTIDGYLSRTDSAARIEKCDILFLPLETGADPLFIPGKIFDYLKGGKPTLILGHKSDCTDILERAGIGILVDPYDAEKIADTLHALIGNKDRLAELYQLDKQYVEENFHFRNLSKQLSGLFEALAGDQSAT